MVIMLAVLRAKMIEVGLAQTQRNDRGTLVEAI